MSTKKPTDAQVVITLQAQIALLTGRVPVSRNREHLERRLASLQRRQADGADVEESPMPSIVMSISVPVAAVGATKRMTKATKLSRSALVRVALAEYAINHDMADEAEHFK